MAGPNLLFLVNDHQAYYRHGWDGGAKILRPQFERLAAEGVEFSRAYTACPLCGPARRTMLTGLYDLERDPFELRNLVRDPTCGGVLDDLRSRLRAWQASTLDPEDVLDPAEQKSPLDFRKQSL